MKFVITAGGTAGHINPALALADELTKRGHDVYFAGTPNRLESKLVPQQNYKFRAFNAYGFNRKHPSSIVKALTSLKKSTRQAKDWLKEIKPNAVIGFGCYVSIPICSAAKSLKIPYVIHEQNSVMGIANKQLSKSATATCLTYKQAKKNYCKNVIVCGNPVRASIFSATKKDGRQMLNIPDDAFVLLVFGGSLGAKRINNAIVDASKQLLQKKDLYIVHISGKDQYKNVKSMLSEQNLSKDELNRYIVLAYQDRMAQTLAAADVCICRAGASTLAEITAVSLPSLLIPYPYATENHQFYNAKSLMEAGCVLYLNDSEIINKVCDTQGGACMNKSCTKASELFLKTVNKLINDTKLRKKMKQSFKKFDAINSATQLADIVIGCASKNSK